MSWQAIIEALALVVALGICVPPLGRYMATVHSGGKAPGDRVFGPIERTIYRISGIDAKREQRWNVYAVSLLAFSMLSILLVYAMQRLQGSLPLNPTDRAGVSPWGAWNVAVSFVTNTNWQWFSGEQVMSHLTQMLGVHGAELRVGGRRHRRVDRHHPRDHPHRHPSARQLLGRPDAHDRAHPAAAGAAVHRGADVAGRHPELPRVHHGATRSRR